MGAGESETTRTFESKLVVLERNHILGWASLAAILAGIALVAAFGLVGFAPGVFGVHLVILGVVLRVIQGKHNYSARRRNRGVKAGRDGVLVDGAVVIGRDRIADGFFQPRPVRSARGEHGSSVRLLDRGRRVIFEAEVATEKQAVELLRSLGLDAASKRAEFRGGSPFASTNAMNFTLAMSLFASALVLTKLLALVGLRLDSLPALLFMTPLFYAAMMPSKIVIGIDGILLRWFWRKRFIPMSEITSVANHGERDIEIELSSGRKETLSTTNNRRGTSAHERQHRDAVYARIIEAVNAYRQRGPTPDVALLVGRGQRSHEEWRRALESLTHVDRGYRQVALRDEDLWRVVEDPRATADARAGAAVLLRRSLDEEGRARVRIAAEATASPQLRVALDAAMGDSEEAIDAALCELATDEPARLAR